jgi:hypothetical protein
MFWCGGTTQVEPLDHLKRHYTQAPHLPPLLPLALNWRGAHGSLNDLSGQIRKSTPREIKS